MLYYIQASGETSGDWDVAGGLASARENKTRKA